MRCDDGGVYFTAGREKSLRSAEVGIKSPGRQALYIMSKRVTYLDKTPQKFLFWGSNP